MDLNHLRYFRAVATVGTLSGAAQQLRVSQPTLTVAIRNLEEELGATLFLRSYAGVQLTPSGHELLRHVEEVLGLLQVAAERVRGVEKDDRGTFVLGCHESLGAYFLPGFLRRLFQEAPNIELNLWNGTSQAVWEAVIERKVHFGLVVNALPHDDLTLVPLFKDAVEILISRDELPEGRDLSFEEAADRLKKGPILLAGRVGQAQELVGRLAAEELLPVRRVSCGDLELVKTLALAGLGVALLPFRVSQYGHEGKLVRLHPQLPQVADTIHLVYRGDIHRTRSAILTKDALVNFGRSL